MKIIIAPDSFKGTLSSSRICDIIANVALEQFPGCTAVKLPIADGGEGSVDCFLGCLPGEKIWITVKNLFMEDMQTFYGFLRGDIAVIEMAACAGLPLAGSRKNPLSATTYGVGQLMLDAIHRGAKKIIVGLGGSATNDGACGAAAACGVRFLNRAGHHFIPVGGTLKDIDKIDISGLDTAFKGIEITAMCDVDNPMYGPNGAAFVFGQQKGASEKDIEWLDCGLRHLCKTIQEDIGMDFSEVPGAGAAGAMGAGMTAFFGAKPRSGIETILDRVKFDDLLAGAHWVITGEGRFDSQSLQGKVVSGIARRAMKHEVPVIVIAGGAETIPNMYAEGISAVFSINRLPEDFSISRHKSEENLSITVENVFRLIHAAGMVGRGEGMAWPE